MSETTQVGQRFEVLRKNGENLVGDVCVVEDSPANHPYNPVDRYGSWHMRNERTGECFTAAYIDHPEHRDEWWRALPPQGVRPAPKVGQRWRFMNTTWTVVEVTGGGDIRARDEADGLVGRHTPAEWEEAVLISEAPAPQVAGPASEGVDKCGYQPVPGAFCKLPHGHDGYHVTPGIEPPAPPQPAPVVCEGQDGSPGCAATTGLLLRKLSKLHDSRVALLCDACYLGYEKSVAGAQERRERILPRYRPIPPPSQPPRWWQPPEVGCRWQQRRGR